MLYLLTFLLWHGKQKATIAMGFSQSNNSLKQRGDGLGKMERKTAPDVLVAFVVGSIVTSVLAFQGFPSGPLIFVWISATFVVFVWMRSSP